MDRDFNLTKKPVTPLVGVDVFIPDPESRVLLIKCTDNGFWCIPEGSHLIGVQGITIRIHLTLNNRLQRLEIDEMDPESLSQERNKFETRWNYFNNIRTLIPFAVSFSLMLFIYAN